MLVASVYNEANRHEQLGLEMVLDYVGSSQTDARCPGGGELALFDRKEAKTASVRYVVEGDCGLDAWVVSDFGVDGVTETVCDGGDRSALAAICRHPSSSSGHERILSDASLETVSSDHGVDQHIDGSVLYPYVQASENIEFALTRSTSHFLISPRGPLHVD
jgi:hypothetical protein